MCGRVGVVAWLSEEHQFRGIDSNYLSLVRQIHRISDCSTFGVSCAGHIRYSWNYDSPKPELDCCYLIPRGSLTLMLNIRKPHVWALIDLIGVIVSDVYDATFSPVNHVFAPRGSNHPLRTWEICFGAAHSLDGFEKPYYGHGINPADFPDQYKAAAKRYHDIKKAWAKLGRAVAEFADKRGFSPIPDIAARVNEQKAVWPQL